VITQEPDPNEPVDLTGNTIVQGNADSYAGGFTTAKGTNTSATRTQPTATGVPGGTGPAQAPVVGPDRSRALSIGDSTEWLRCPFPPEADAEQIDEAYVGLKLEVRADGTASVTVVGDPGHGFGREARRFALAKRFLPALDHDGNPITATKVFKVHFQR
jgi:periplasmic protein TonB